MPQCGLGRLKPLEKYQKKVVENTFGAKIQAFYPLLKCRSSSAAAGGESPSMADMSSNNGEESPQSPQKQTRAKKGGGKRKSRRNLLTPPNQGYSSGAEQSQSAFPIPTPDRLGTFSRCHFAR